MREVELFVSKSVVESSVVQDPVHGGCGVKIVSYTDGSDRSEYVCALGLTFDQAKKLSLHLSGSHVKPGDAGEIIEDWLYDHAE